MKDYFSDLPQKRNVALRKDDNNSEPSTTPPAPTPIPTSPEAAIVMGVVDITKETIRCFTDYAKCKEHEITERKRIASTLKAIEYKIDAQKEVYLKELDNKYEERNRLYSIAEKVLEKALDIGDNEMLIWCSNFMLNVYNKPIEKRGTTSYLMDGQLDSLDSF